jgi:hypothetical protein
LALVMADCLIMLKLAYNTALLFKHTLRTIYQVADDLGK